jgi:hypothetical protein
MLLLEQSDMKAQKVQHVGTSGDFVFELIFSLQLTLPKNVLCMAEKFTLTFFYCQNYLIFFWIISGFYTNL